MNAPNDLQTMKQQMARAPSAQPVRAGFFDIESFELMQRVAKGFSASDLVPSQYRGNIANAMIALDMAQRMGANPLMIMQNLYVVHGTPSWSAKFLIATINSCGRFSSLRYEWAGKNGADDYGCRAWAIERETGERLNGIWVTWKMVNAEGWSKKAGSKWNTMPDQMFVYRAASFWQRAYAPEVGMGLQTAEEVEDVYDAIPDGRGGYKVDIASMKPVHEAPQPEEHEATPDSADNGATQPPVAEAPAEKSATAKQPARPANEPPAHFDDLNLE